MIAMHTGVPASTVHKILVRHGLNRLSWIDRPTGRVIRRHERAHPGELIGFCGVGESLADRGRW